MTKAAKRNTVDLRETINKYQENCDRISEIADLCEQEKRERTDAETKEYDALVRENQVLSMRLQAAAADHLREHPNAPHDAEKLIRENAKRGVKTEITLLRETDFMMVSDVSNSAVIPLNVGDIIKPLYEGFILDKVGLPMPTGLHGDFVWPTYEMVEATVLDEAAALTDTKIPFSKLAATPARMGIAIPVTNQSLNQTDGLLEKIVKELMPLSIRMLLNKILFSLEAVNQTAGTAGLVGPFIEALKTKVALSSVPTFKELNADMKASVLETGIDGEHLCWVMTKSMQAILEGTAIQLHGIQLPMVQNNHLCGLPIYTTNAIRKVVRSYKKYSSASGGSWNDYTLQNTDSIKFKVRGDSEAHALAKIKATPSNNDIAEVSVLTEFIGLGDWRYQPMGMFGALRFIIDPYSQARKDSVDFVLNCDYATKTLRPEAFLIGEVGVASDD